MEGATIKVKTEVLEAKAGAVEGLIRLMEQDFDIMQNAVNRTAEYWVGEAGDAYRMEFRTEYETIVQMMNRLKVFPSGLREMAGVYHGGIVATESIARALPSNILD